MNKNKRIKYSAVVQRKTCDCDYDSSSFWLKQYVAWERPDGREEEKEREWIIYNGFVEDFHLCSNCELSCVTAVDRKYPDTHCLQEYTERVSKKKYNVITSSIINQADKMESLL